MNNLLAPAVLQTIFGIVIAILVLLLTITVHEFGHYIVGKILKFKITEFAIGMGPAIYKKKKKNGEIFSIRIFPLGGFCAFEGEDDAGSPGANKKDYEDNKKATSEQETVFEGMPEPNADDSKNLETSEAIELKTAKTELSPNAFDNKKPWERILVLIAGGITNIIFAILIVAINFSIYGHFCLTAGEVKPANGAIEQDASLLPGDKLIEIDGHYLYLTSDLGVLKGKKQGDRVKVKIERNGKQIETEVALRSDVENVSLTDYFECFDALGIGTTLIFSTTDENGIFPNGAYLVGLSNGVSLTPTERIYSVNEFIEALSGFKSGDKVSFIINDGEDKILTIEVPNGFEDVKNGEYASGKEKLAAYKKHFKLDGFYIQYDIQSTESRLGFFEGLYRAPVYGFKTTIVSLQSLWGLLSGEVGIDQVSGPVGTISMTSQIVSMGFNYVLEMLAMIGISIGVFNLLPIPALDGGRVVFVIIEWIRGKPIKKSIEGTIHFVGLVALLGFAILVDLLKLF